MIEVKLDIADERMLKLIDILIQLGVLRFKKAFTDSLGLQRQTRIQIVSGKQHFTSTHIYNACKIYNVNANWIYGFEDNIFRVKSLKNDINKVD